MLNCVCVVLLTAFVGADEAKEAVELLEDAYRLFDGGEFEKAHKELDKTIALDPTLAKAFCARGSCWVVKGELKRAIEDYDRAIKLDAKVPKFFVARGTAYLLLSDWKRAEGDFDEAIRLDPKFGPAFHNRGNLWVQLEKWEKALGDFNEAIRLDPKDADAMSNRGALFIVTGRWEQAMKDLNASLVLDPKHPLALANRALLLACCPDVKYRNSAKAITDAVACCELTGWKYPNYIAILAAAHAEGGDYKSAIKWQKKALENPAFVASGHDLTGALELYQREKSYRMTPRTMR
jgi:tetratricopeptide (TPR) repeat protein